MKYTVVMASCVMIHLPSFLKIGTGIRASDIKVLHQQFERLGWHC
jgi:hypothetical protein